MFGLINRLIGRRGSLFNLSATYIVLVSISTDAEQPRTGRGWHPSSLASSQRLVTMYVGRYLLSVNYMYVCMCPYKYVHNVGT